MNSAWSPSSCKKPLFCPTGRELYEAMSSENPIRNLSAAWAEFCRKIVVSNTKKILFTRHLLRAALLSFANPEIPLRVLENREIPCCSPTSGKTPLELVFPELLEKTVLVDFLEQRKIDKTLRRRLSCLRLP